MDFYTFSANDVDTATDAAMETLLWQAGDRTDEEGNTTGTTWDEDFDVDDFAPGQRDKMRALIEAFMNDEEETNLEDLQTVKATPEQIGHDYVLTTGGHGAGFWDRGYGEAGERLSEVCRAERAEWYLYVGADDMLHCGDLD